MFDQIVLKQDWTKRDKDSKRSVDICKGWKNNGLDVVISAFQEVYWVLKLI